MSEGGYTLVEMLAALAILGLSITATVAAVSMVGKLQGRAASTAASSEQSGALSSALETSFRGRGPFASAGAVPLGGTATAIDFACGLTRCSLRYTGGARPRLEVMGPGERRRLSAPGGLAFRYLGSRTSGDHWPPDNPTDWQRLDAIELVDRGARPVAITRLWITGQTGGAVP